MLSLKTIKYELIDALGLPLDQIQGVGLPVPDRCRIKRAVDRVLVDSTPYNVCFDLTLSKGQHCGKISVLEKSLKYQRQYLINMLAYIINKYNANFTDTQILASFAVFELQKNANLHCHSNLHITNNTGSSITPIALLKDYAKQVGFNINGVYVDYIADRELRMQYLLKPDTKYPDSFCISEWNPIKETQDVSDGFSLDFE